jgi:hypothetical protein
MRPKINTFQNPGTNNGIELRYPYMPRSPTASKR